MGPQGLQGLQGPQGPQGQPGLNGNVGPVGPAGPQGSPGENGALGPMGPMGPKGNDGAMGPAGPQGQAGQAGAVGPLGPQGPAGPQGLQGVPGDCVECPCECEHPEYLEAFSNLKQNLLASPALNLAGGELTFENLVVSTANIDATNIALTGEIVINKKGWYRIISSVNGTLNPLSRPLIAWGLALFRNGLLVQGSAFVNMTLSPDQQDNQVTQAVLLYFNAGDKFKLHNMTSQVLEVSNVNAGVNCLINSASIQVQSVD
jgi:hypothetical protein